MIDDFYTQMAEVQKSSDTQTDMGGQSRSWSTRITALKCRLSRKREGFSELDEYGKVLLRAVLRLYCAATITNKEISSDDRIILDNKKYEIKGRPYNPGGLNRHLELELVETE